MTSIGVIRAMVVFLKANMVVKTTAIYIPLRTVQEKQYFVIRDEESKSFGFSNLLSLSLSLSLYSSVQSVRSVFVLKLSQF